MLHKNALNIKETFGLGDHTHHTLNSHWWVNDVIHALKGLRLEPWNSIVCRQFLFQGMGTSLKTLVVEN